MEHLHVRHLTGFFQAASLITGTGYASTDFNLWGDGARAFLILVVGYPKDDAQVPRIGKKPLDEIATFI